jgi:hypothetical protein
MRQHTSEYVSIRVCAVRVSKERGVVYACLFRGLLGAYETLALKEAVGRGRDIPTYADAC